MLAEPPTNTPPRLEQEARAPEARERRVPWYQQPYKSLYLTYQFGILFLLQLPLLSLRFLIPSQRPSKEWKCPQGVSVVLIRDIIRIGMNGGLIQTRADVTKKDMPDTHAIRKAFGSDCRAVFLEPISEDDVVGEVKDLMIKNDVHPAGVPAYWYGENIADAPLQRAAMHEKVVIHFHGGGYVIGSARAGTFHDWLPRDILDRAQKHSAKPIKRIINVEYRLTRTTPLMTPANAFPAALIDGLTVVHYLVYELGFHPRNIIFSGNSAGGNLALGLTRYLRDAPLPSSRTDVTMGRITSLLPGGMILFCPWCDVASTHIPERAGANCSYVRNANTDAIGRYPYTKERPELGLNAYALRGLGGKALTALDIAKNPFLSPGSLDVPLTIEPTDPSEKPKGTLEGYPPSYISVGGREMLYDEITLFARRLQDQADHQYMPTTAIADGSISSDDTQTETPSTNGHSSDVETLNETSTKRYNWVTVEEEPEMWHDYVSTPFSRPEALRTIDAAIAWLAALPTASEITSMKA